MGSAFLLVTFIKLLFVTDSPRLVAGLYTAVVGIGAIVSVATGASIVHALVGVALSGAIALAYFWSLLRLPPWTVAWWSVVVVGAVLVAVV